MNRQVEIFTKVRDILQSEGFVDQEVSDNYETIFRKLRPNHFTFQQVMTEYLSEFNSKVLEYCDEAYYTNGFRVRRSGDALVVTSVTEDTRLVVGDRIVSLSGDSIRDLGERYKKVLFYETEDRQDWHPILKKQVGMTILRGDETYQFEMKTFKPDGMQRISHDDFDELIVRDISVLRDFKASRPLLIDLRQAFGVVSHDIHINVPFVLLVDAFTKGSAERFASLNSDVVIGQETYGQAVVLEQHFFDDQKLISSKENEHTVEPKYVTSLSEEMFEDKARKKGIELLNQKIQSV